MDILEIKNVTYNYSNSREKILLSVNQKFELGQFYAIIGKSGAGKSTLLSLLAGLDKPQRGQILFKNEDIESKGYSNHRKNNITLVFQNYNLIILDEPFQGVDIASRFDIGKYLRENIEDKTALILVADLDEAIEVADRIIIFNSGKMVFEQYGDNIDRDKLLHYISCDIKEL